MKRSRAEKCWKMDFHPDEKRTTRNGSRLRNDKGPSPSRVEALRLLKESAVARSPKVLRNPELESREMDHSLEENLLAFFDTDGARDLEEIEEDKLIFLDATYPRSVVRADASVPTEKMYQAMFRNVQESRSLELAMASFQLLKDLEKRHPQVAIVEELDESTERMTLRLDVDSKVWSPLEQTIEEMGDPNFMLSVSSTEGQVPLNLVLLVERVAKDVAGQGRRLVRRRRSTDSVIINDGTRNVNIMGQFLMLEHLVNLTWKDFSCRLQVSEARMDPKYIRKSLFYRLFHVLASPDRSSFLSNLVSILNPFPVQEESENFKADDQEGHGFKMKTAAGDGVVSKESGLLPSPRDFSHLAHQLLFMVQVMEIASINRTWPFNENISSSFDLKYLADSFSIPGDLEAYLQGIHEPRKKLRFILQYCAGYALEVRDLIQNDLEEKMERTIVEKLLSCLGEKKFQKFVHKFKQDFLQLLLAHAFQAFLILHAEAAGQDHQNGKLFHSMKLVEVCNSLHKVLNDIHEYERQDEMLPVAENALLMAEFILISGCEMQVL